MPRMYWGICMGNALCGVPDWPANETTSEASGVPREGAKSPAAWRPSVNITVWPASAAWLVPYLPSRHMGGLVHFELANFLPDP
jgi:hypothetical protein